tara:strand:+ start:3339 stop:4694 length:1356 start_codon:yes stop_codon:yes gene_type:complete
MTEGVDDQKITLAHLYKAILNIKELIEDRDALLQSMFKEDLYADFLMREQAQSAPMIDAMEGGGPDISPNSPALPDDIDYERTQSTPDVHVDDGGPTSSEGSDLSSQAARDMEGSTRKMAAGGTAGGAGMNAFSPVDNPSNQSLAESGFDDTFQKNISDNLEKDFQIDGRLKEAFGASLALPMKAAAAGLMQVFKMIPQIGIGGNINNIVNNNLNSISKSLGISSENVTQTGDTASTNLFQSVVNSGVNNFLGMGGNGMNGMNGANGANGTPGSTGSSMAADNKFLNNLTNSTTLADNRSGGNRFNILNPFGGTQKGLQEGNKARSGTRTSTDTSTPLGQMLNRTNTTNQLMNQLMSSTSNVGGDNILNSIASLSTGDSKIALLTDTVINEGNNLLMIEDAKTQKDIEQMNASEPEPYKANLENESGFKDAIASTIKSAIFDEYALMSQFG